MFPKYPLPSGSSAKIKILYAILISPIRVNIMQEVQFMKLQPVVRPILNGLQV
jgi:hypothetical protein